MCGLCTLAAATLGASLAFAADNSSLPWVKQIAAPRDNSFPAAYYQDWIFDSTFGINDSVPDQSYFGRDDISELYSSTPTSFTTPPSTNYSTTVIGPDGAYFNDEDTAFSIFAYKTFPYCIPPPSVPIDDEPGPVLAFYWAASTNKNVDNTTFATNLGGAIVNTIAKNSIYNASIYVNVPGTDSRSY